ncbi:MAG: nucleotidyltransferase domain-containing protein [Propionibacteriaceae bacterium]|jgi:predicted nucleotidyltransferase|nr:nucleotidyltransferase domain-containing protein [Propionibacteriaceae bacterium]
MRPSEVLRTRREELRSIVRAHGVENPRIFGSVARGTDTAESDLDLLVAVPQGAALGFLQLAESLSTQLGVKVDVVSEKGLRGPYRQILEEAVPV